MAHGPFGTSLLPPLRRPSLARFLQVALRCSEGYCASIHAHTEGAELRGPTHLNQIVEVRTLESSQFDS
eukprot:9476875-Pyramimonas_sp.AAC.1